jgi:zinc/manganese transport system substrate-binding protein
MVIAAVSPLLLTSLLSGCGSSSAGSGATLRIVAGQNFWGSIASQLAGSHGKVQSVVTDPNADPHEYAGSSSDARAFADANIVILNGAGYDDWGKRLLDANPASDRQVLTIADLLGKKAGDNPHFWYDPANVVRVADKITELYEKQDSADSAYFTQQRAAFSEGLKPYQARIAEIKRRYSGVAVGSTESIFEYMAAALGLNLVSTPEFMKAVAEGNDPPADAVAQFQDQVTQKKIKVLVYNVQTSTLVTTNIKKTAVEAGIEVVGVSETLQPESATFQEWQLAQLLQLENALNAEALVK